ncbi:MAG: TRAP transporter TatT component family protein [Proteobacteria bacterium]|nr:TRAP transporter TatT component family protein [Pseudomonadota bacterium]
MIRSQVLLVAVGVVVGGGCGGFIDRQAASTTLRILHASLDVAGRQPDVELARAAMPSGIIQLAAFAQAYPDERQFRTMHADALCQYAAGFVFDDWEDASLGGRPAEADRIAERLAVLLPACVDAQLALLPPAWRAAREGSGEAFIAQLARATPAQAPALLAIATADAVEVALAPLLHLATVPRLRATLTRCLQLAPGAHDADGEILLATIEAAMGDDAAPRFARAKQLVGDRVLTVELMAAWARKDRAALTALLAIDVTRWPERRLANELARRKARRYLATFVE